jgi:SAM domain (Sterile alpha motif)
MPLALVLRSSPHGRCLPHPLRCLVLSARVEAMKKHFRVGGGKPAKARSRKPSRLKRNMPKTIAHRNAATEFAEWLEKLGLGQYAQRFAENDISFAVLPDLTDQDLKEIGVSLGHRRQLLRAIVTLPHPEEDPRAERLDLGSAWEASGVISGCSSPSSTTRWNQAGRVGVVG